MLAHLGLEVNRLIRISYGPFQLGELPEGAVEEVKAKVLRDQLGEKIADSRAPISTADAGRRRQADEADAPRGRSRSSRRGESGLIADRKGRRVLVQRARRSPRPQRGRAAARSPRRPQRGSTAADEAAR